MTFNKGRDLFKEVANENARNRSNADGKLKDKRWGSWTLDPALYTLDLYSIDGHHLYQIDLEKCTSSSKTLDIIFQVSAKDFSDIVVSVPDDLITALRDILNPQKTLCSFGGSTFLEAADIRKRVDALVNVWPQNI